MPAQSSCKTFGPCSSVAFRGPALHDSNAALTSPDTTHEASWWARTQQDAAAPDRDLLVAYFSMEFAVDPGLPIYSGGLGVLAGDHLKAAADLGLPLVGVGLFYRGGYFKQGLDARGRQTEDYLPVDPVAAGLQREPVSVEVELDEETVTAAVWRYDVGTAVGRTVPLYLLDVDLLTDALYSGDREHRIRQELLLGVGGVRALTALGLAPTVFHVNEGHSALLAIERMRELVEAGEEPASALERVRSSTIFTTHTPVPAGNEVFGDELVVRYAGDLATRAGLSNAELLALGRANGTDGFGLTPLALRLSTAANGVSELHGEVAREMWSSLWPGEQPRIGHVTNGVHLGTWLAPELDTLVRSVGTRPDAPPDDGNWEAVHELGSSELWAAHATLKQRLAAMTGTRQRAADDLLRAPFRDLQARRARLLRPRAPARAPGPDRRRGEGAPAGRARQGRHAAHRRAVPRPPRRRSCRVPRELRSGACAHHHPGL